MLRRKQEEFGDFPEKEETDKQQVVRLTFWLTYALLFTTGTITLIEGLRTKNPEIRHIMNLETCISVVAAFFYSKFVADISTKRVISEEDFAEITRTRYTDWFVTTPLMLLVLCLVLAFDAKRKVHLYQFIIVLVLDYAMLSLGYAGETGALDKVLAGITSYATFFALFGFIYASFFERTSKTTSYVVFGAFLVLWSAYGAAYFLEGEEEKNATYNVLDLFAKCFVGIFFWLYLAQVIVI